MPILKAMGNMASRNLGIASPIIIAKYALEASELITNSKKRMDCVSKTIIVSEIAVIHVAAIKFLRTYLSKMDITLECLN